MFLDKIIPYALAQDTSSGNLIDTSKEGLTKIQEIISFVVSHLDNWIAGLLFIFGSYVLAKIINDRIRNKIIEKKGEEAQESVIILIQRITKILIVGLGVTIAAAINGFNFTAVIGALSLGIGFALKDVIGTFISSIVLLSQNRIRIGDFIQMGDIMGTIVSIDTRVTVLQAMDGSEVVIPNQQMLNTTIISYTMNPFRRIELNVGVDYNSDLRLVTSLIKGIIEKDSDIASKPDPLVLVDTFGDSSINIKVYFWVESKKSWLKIRSNLAYRIRKAFSEAGINIPFPIRTLKLDEDDRSFLKTIDSARKRIVPDKKQSPDINEIRTVAANSEKISEVPESLFEKIKPQAPVPAKEIVMPVNPPPTQINPPKKETPGVPPPTHL